VSVSLVLTVLNEAGSLPALLESIERQTRPVDELVVVDGGSRDATISVLKAWAGRLPLVVITEPGANISRGRNIALQRARGDVILVTDGGVVLEPQWAESLVRAIEATEHPAAVAGFFVADPHTVFEAAMGATVLPAADDVDPARFLPSSRSFAVRREAALAVGGYPEWLDYCEDLILDFALRDRYGRFAWAPDAIARFRPRGSLGAFFRQYYRYARGDGKANLWLRRHLIRYVTYLIAAVLLAVAVLAPIALLPLAVGGLVYCWRPLQRVQAMGLRGTDRLAAWLLVPVIRVVGDVAKMLGYPVGVLWRLRHRRKSATRN
jgi:glycosyltransferase involved in cell wall biosynthesis